MSETHSCLAPLTKTNLCAKERLMYVVHLTSVHSQVQRPNIPLTCPKAEFLSMTESLSSTLHLPATCGPPSQSEHLPSMTKSRNPFQRSCFKQVLACSAFGCGCESSFRLAWSRIIRFSKYCDPGGIEQSANSSQQEPALVLTSPTALMPDRLTIY